MTDQARLWPDRPKRARGRVTIGLEQTLKAMRELGRLDPIDAALVALARESAELVVGAVRDPDVSPHTTAVVIGRYHAVLTHLLTGPDDGDDGPSLADLLAGALDTADTDTPQ